MPSETYIGLIVPISNTKHNKENIHLSLREKTMSGTDYVKKTVDSSYTLQYKDNVLNYSNNTQFEFAKY